MLSNDIIHDLFHSNRVFCSSGYDFCVDYLCRILPFTRRRFESGDSPQNGWVVHPKWDVIAAHIIHDGRVILDATEHPLSVIALSTPFQGEVTLDELKRHLHRPGDTRASDDSVRIHYRQQYRPWERDWGFSVSNSFYRSLKPGTYQVRIETKEEAGYLDILEYTHQGALDETFVLVTHLAHQGMANANHAGCAVAVEFFNAMRQRSTKYSYRLVVSQPTIGAEYYLNGLGAEGRMQLLGALFLGGTGTSTPFSLQFSASGDSVVDRAMRHALEGAAAYRTGPFRSIVTYDEAIWAAYRIPMTSLTRYPYPEYHTSDDNFSIIGEHQLQESLNVLKRFVDELERQRIVKSCMVGVPCVSNPKYDLFVDSYFDVYLASEGESDRDKLALREVMDFLPLIDTHSTVDKLRERFSIREDLLMPYLERWQSRGLIDIL